MNQPTNHHVIVGEGKRCLCGVYSGKAIFCHDLLAALARLSFWAKAETNPSLYIPAGGEAPIAPSPEDILLLESALNPLVEQCGDYTAANVPSLIPKALDEI